MGDELADRARAAWAELAGAAFPDQGVRVVCSPGSRLCPPGWVGSVTIGGATLVTTPTEDAAAQVSAARLEHRPRPTELPAGQEAAAKPAGQKSAAKPAGPEAAVGAAGPEAAAKPARQESAAKPAGPEAAVEPTGQGAAVGAAGQIGLAGLPVLEMLGPAELAYLGQPVRDPRAVEWVAAGHPDLGALFGAVTADELKESGLDRPADEAGSAVAVVREGGRVVAAAAYTRWPGGAAHIGVLTAAGARGRGLAGVVGAAVSIDALAAGLLPQWRARVPASQRVAARLGYRVLGRQFSLRLRA